MSPPNLSALPNIQEGWLKMMRTRGKKQNKTKQKQKQKATLWAKKLA